MVLLRSSTCVVAAQRWVKRAPKSRSVVGGEVAQGRRMVVPEVGVESKKHSSSDSLRKGLHLTDFMQEQETHYQHW